MPNAGEIKVAALPKCPKVSGPSKKAKIAIGIVIAILIIAIIVGIVLGVVFRKKKK